MIIKLNDKKLKTCKYATKIDSFLQLVQQRRKIVRVGTP
jgi:hypothetical protein